MDERPPPMSGGQRWAVVGIVVWAIAFTFVGGLTLVEVAVGGSLLVASFVLFVVLLAAPLVFLLRRRRRTDAA